MYLLEGSWSELWLWVWVQHARSYVGEQIALYTMNLQLIFSFMFLYHLFPHLIKEVVELVEYRGVVLGELLGRGKVLRSN